MDCVLRSAEIPSICLLGTLRGSVCGPSRRSSSLLFVWPVLFNFLHSLTIPWVLDGVFSSASPACLQPVVQWVRGRLSSLSQSILLAQWFKRTMGHHSGRSSHVFGPSLLGMRCSYVLEPESTTVFSASWSACGIPGVDLRCRRDYGPSTVGCSVPYRFSFPFRCGVTSLGLLEVSVFVSWIPLRRLYFGLQVRLVKGISLPCRMSASICYAAIPLWKG